jgi:hypothetical protein
MNSIERFRRVRSSIMPSCSYLDDSGQPCDQDATRTVVAGLITEPELAEQAGWHYGGSLKIARFCDGHFSDLQRHGLAPHEPGPA